MPTPAPGYARVDINTDRMLIVVCRRAAAYAETLARRADCDADPYPELTAGRSELQLVADLGGAVADITTYIVRRAIRPHLGG